MKFMIAAGKAITLVAWFMMGYNLVMPFEGDISLILNTLLLLTLVMHSIQTLIFHRLFKTLLPLTQSDYLNVFVFGVFSLLSYRREVLAKITKP
ncbi:DUF1145 domain-containing protein [Shewanella sp. D64]|uniref:DUF1145 domain-containing protein n=1 Tax=unclassified Shewanella TaxID=196818 RepID=UPI0022BA6132|nr:MULTISPECIES: DUF1145 domain-containing protein [unclassified Shewanella]MEC4728751.1 DUF1145 domain-containing protein [Shewanella sp. D64]MEC4740620.1 DUF1145 domain-containing protein [Shewanella sp. E94]WBJ95135.1 DUF1145 domain-containing protein [Shewanella sp. MTB7]